MNQWKNTSAVLKWYKKIPNKIQYSFIQFDIESFYPSIIRGLMNKSYRLSDCNGTRTPQPTSLVNEHSTI